jgi:hypothetical protein
MAKQEQVKVEEVATPEPTDVEAVQKPTRKVRGLKTDKPAKEPKAPKEPKEGGTGAPRPRKVDYGMAPANVVSVVDLDPMPKLTGEEAAAFTKVENKVGITVDELLTDTDRGVVRRICRKGLLKITAPNGTVYPRPYEKPEAPAKAEKAEEAAA